MIGSYVGSWGADTIGWRNTFFLDLISMGLGSTSSAFSVTSSIQPLAMSRFATPCVWAVAHYFSGARTMRGDLLKTEAMNARLAKAR